MSSWIRARKSLLMPFMYALFSIPLYPSCFTFGIVYAVHCYFNVMQLFDTMWLIIHVLTTQCLRSAHYLNANLCNFSIYFTKGANVTPTIFEQSYWQSDNDKGINIASHAKNWFSPWWDVMPQIQKRICFNRIFCSFKIALLVKSFFPYD